MDEKDQKSKNQFTYFEKQRDALISEIAVSMDSVLNNINALNRSLEGTIAVGKEFDSVANLWSHFYDGLAQVEQLKGVSEESNKEERTGSDNVEEVQQTKVDQQQQEDNQEEEGTTTKN